MRTFLDVFQHEYVEADQLAASTKAKYLSHLRHHIRPAFGHLELAEIDTRTIERFLSEKAAAGYSWNTRADLRNLLAVIYSTAIRWGMYDGRNPAAHARIGRKKAKREQRKLSTMDIRRLLERLPADVRLIVGVCVSCGLRISEVLGLQWRHVDLDRGIFHIEQRYYRGNVDETKTERSRRRVPIGDHIAAELRQMTPGAPEDWLFSVTTTKGVSRSENSIRRYYVTKAAKELGIYFQGFGWHSFRREALTAVAAHAGLIQAMRLAGHGKVDMTLHYGLEDLSVQAAAIGAFQNQLGMVPQPVGD